MLCSKSDLVRCLSLAQSTSAREVIAVKAPAATSATLTELLLSDDSFWPCPGDIFCSKYKATVVVVEYHVSLVLLFVSVNAPR